MILMSVLDSHKQNKAKHTHKLVPLIHLTLCCPIGKNTHALFLVVAGSLLSHDRLYFLLGLLKGDGANAVPHYQKLHSRVICIWDNRKGQPDRSAMTRPHPGGTALLITVSSEPEISSSSIYFLLSLNCLCIFVEIPCNLLCNATIYSEHDYICIFCHFTSSKAL